MAFVKCIKALKTTPRRLQADSENLTSSETGEFQCHHQILVSILEHLIRRAIKHYGV